MSDRMFELRAKLSAHMRANGLKNTRQRDLIFLCFVEDGGHVSVDDLLASVQERNSAIGYATVYRALKLFVTAGVAHERRFMEKQARYEPVSLDDDHHDHLICTDCGHIFEFDDEVIEVRQTQIAESHGLRITGHRHQVYGSCVERETCNYRQN